MTALVRIASWACLATVGLLGIRWLGRARWRAQVSERLDVRSPRTTSRLGVALRVPSPVHAALEQAGLGRDATRWWTRWVVTVLVGPSVVLVVGGPGLSFLAALAIIIGPAVLLASRHGHGEREVERALPDLLERIGRTLRSGGSLPSALAEAAATASPVLADDLGTVVAGLERGMALEEALTSWAHRRPSTAVTLVVGALGLAGEVGGAQARAVDAVADTIRARLAARDERRAAGAQARASALVMALAPVAFAAASAGLDPRTANVMTGSAAGIACVTLGLGFDAMAAWWMFRLTARAGR